MGGPRRLPQGDATPAQLAEARLALGPAIGVERFQEYVEERYGKVPRHVARAFLRSFDYNQMYSAPADTRAGGKTATTGYIDSWFLDLIALEKRTPKTDPYKYIMLAINVYTGYIFAKPLKSTGTAGPEGTAAVFTSILEESAGLNPPQGPPKSVTTDASTTEWGGAFKQLLIREDIIHRVKQPEDRNAIGKLDSTVGQIKAILFRGMGERERKSWRTELPELVRQYNNDVGHEGSFGTKPSEVRGPEPTELRGDNVADFQVMRQNARALVHNTQLNQKNRDNVVSEGAFRHALGYWKKEMDGSNRTLNPKWSAAVHQVAEEVGPYVRDADGQLYNPKLALPVHPESKNVKVPAFLAEAGMVARDEKRRGIYPWAKRIHAWMKADPRERISALEITRHWEHQAGFAAAMKEHLGKAKKVGAKPVAVMTLFPRYFRKAGSKQVWKAVGTLPAEFQPRDEDSDGEDFMEDAEEVPPPAGGAAAVPALRLRGKTAPAAADDAALRGYLSDLRAWLSAQPGRMATGAAAMRYLRTRRGFRDFVRRNVRYARAENLVFASDALELLPGSGAFNPRIRAKAGVDRPAPDAERGPVLAYASKAKGPDESARPMVPVGGGLGAQLLRARAAA